VKIDVRLLVSSAHAVFHGDQPLAAGGFNREIAAALGKRFDFTEVGSTVRDDQTEMWVARRGKFRGAGAEKATEIQQAQGNELDLAVDVMGSWQQARAALEEVWRCLAGSSAPPLDSVATIVDRTTATVGLPVTFFGALPAFRAMRDDVVRALTEAGETILGEPMPRFSIEIVGLVGARRVDRRATFEPRATARLEEKLYYTTSPLRSDKHLAWVEAIVRGLGGDE
jgi:hypothetical protein